MEFGLSSEQSWFHLVQLLIAWVLTLPVAWDRELVVISLINFVSLR